MPAIEDCTPVLEPCQITLPEWVLPTIKTDILQNYFNPILYLDGNFNIGGVAQNTFIQGFRLGGLGGSNDEINHWVVNQTAPGVPMFFDFKAALDLYNDFSDNGDPSVVDGYPAHLNFFGSTANDMASGGTEADEFFGREGDDTFMGREGNDWLVGGLGDDDLYGGDDDDIIDGGGGMDDIFGGDGNDAINGGRGGDNIDGGAGDDCIEGGDGNDIIIDLSGNNLIYGNAAVPGPNVPPQPDNDFIQTGDGDDVILGQGGDDVIIAGDGDNQVDGGTGNDNITTGNGADIIIGGTGNDDIRAGDGDDEVCAGDGDDVVRAQGGNDKVQLGAGNDLASGGDGDDIILGEGGNDGIEGNDGDDHLAGGAGSDRLFGGNGDDVLWFGEGSDLGEGGAGSDTFAFDDDGGTLNLGQNLIDDFMGIPNPTVTPDGINFNIDTIDLKCVEALTHMSVVELSDNWVRFLGYSAELEPGQDATDYTGQFDDLVFDIFIQGANVGGDGNGILMQDSAYSAGSGFVCLNEGVLVDIGTPDDLDWVSVPAGGDDFGFA